MRPPQTLAQAFRFDGSIATIGLVSLVFQILSQRACLYFGLWDAPDLLALVVLNLSSVGMALGLFLGVKQHGALAPRERPLFLWLAAQVIAAGPMIQACSALGRLSSWAAMVVILPVFILLGIELALRPVDAQTLLISLNAGAVLGLAAYHFAAFLPFGLSFAGLAVLVCASRRVWRPAAVLAAIGIAAARLFPLPRNGSVGPFFTPLGVIDVHPGGRIAVDSLGSMVGTHVARKGDLARVEEQARVPYAIRRPRTVLILGTGGGQDIAAALYYGARAVTAVELNRYLVELMKGPLAGASNGLFLDPRVRIVEDEARHALRYLDGRFDLIAIQRPWTRYLYDRLTHNASASLLSAQAFRDYWSRLTPDGLLFLALPGQDRCPPLPVEDAMRRGLPAGVPERQTAVLSLMVQNEFRQPVPQSMCVILVSKGSLGSGDRRALARYGGAFLPFPAEAPRSGEGGSRELPLLGFFAAAAAALLWFALWIVQPAATDLPAPLYAGMGIAYLWIEARLLARASFFLGDIPLAYQLVYCSFLLFGGLGYLHSGRLRRVHALVAPLVGVAVLLLADGRFSLMWDRGPGLWQERAIVVGLCGAIGYLAAFPFGYALSRERRPVDALAWDCVGLFLACPTVSAVWDSSPAWPAYGAIGLYGCATAWMILGWGKD